MDCLKRDRHAPLPQEGPVLRESLRYPAAEREARSTIVYVFKVWLWSSFKSVQLRPEGRNRRGGTQLEPQIQSPESKVIQICAPNSHETSSLIPCQ